MATGVKPRDEQSQLTQSDLDVIQEAMKSKKFRELLADYCEEVRDPANQAIYQKEMTQLEKERGYDVTFINPKGGYVIKTSVAGDRKAFINICSNDNIGKPSCCVQEVNGLKGMNWQLPYSIIPPREDYDNKKERCVIYDVVFHPDTLRMAEVNKQFRELVNKTAYEGLQKTYNIHFDSNNFRFPKSQYKGINVPAVIRKEDPSFNPSVDEESGEFSPDLLDKLYPQRNYTGLDQDMTKPDKMQRKSKTQKTEFSHISNEGYTIPKYVIKQQKNVDFQDYTYHKNSKQYCAIPSHIVVEVNLPCLSSTKECVLDIREKSLCFQSDNPAKYKLDITLPYAVDDECGNAKFDKTKRMLIVVLPVVKQNFANGNTNSLKVDSGVESEENSGSQSDEDKENRIEVLSSKVNEPFIKPPESSTSKTSLSFLQDSLSYILPSYTHNVLDDIVAFTFHVKNTEPDSVKVQQMDGKVYITFTSVGSGFVPVHYAAVIKFDDNVKFGNVSGEAWDNNVILQMDIVGEAPQKFQIGLSEDSMVSEHFDMSQVPKPNKSEKNVLKEYNMDVGNPLVEVTNSGTETNIVVSSNQNDDDDDTDEDDIESPTTEEKRIVWVDSGSCENSAKSILRKPVAMMRSYSESSAGDVASSMDYISSDYNPEGGSFKKTVRFSNVIARQFYRHNSSIEGQKKKNQRKKSKKRTQERRKSESEAEDDVMTSKVSKPRLKSVLKERRDSGLADTSDAEAEFKSTPVDYETDDTANTPEDATQESLLNIIDKEEKRNETRPAIWKSESQACEGKKKKPHPMTCDSIKHNTDLYNPDKLNKGQYLEVSFKNDLIFDLDM